jgi:hypothetical protein
MSNIKKITELLQNIDLAELGDTQIKTPYLIPEFEELLQLKEILANYDSVIRDYLTESAKKQGVKALEGGDYKISYVAPKKSLTPQVEDPELLDIEYQLTMPNMKGIKEAIKEKIIPVGVEMVEKETKEIIKVLKNKK